MQVEHGGLGELEVQTLGREPRAGELVNDDRHQVAALELPRRQVHCDAQLALLSRRRLPAHRVAARHGQHLSAELDDETTFLGDRHEARRRGERSIKLADSGERLEPDHLARTQIDDRLIVGDDAFAVESGLQTTLRAQAVLDLHTQRLVVHLSTVTPEGLRPVHRLVRFLQQPLGGCVAVGRDSDADARCHSLAGHCAIDPLTQFGDQSCADVDGVEPIDDVGGEYHQFVSTDPRHGVARAQGADQLIRCPAQDVIARCVSVCVVHPLETVEIDEEHRRVHP